MKRFLLVWMTVLSFLGGLYAQSDNMSVSKFEMDPGSYAAQQDAVKDNNGNLCALVEITIRKYRDFSFTGSYVFPNQTKQIVGGYKVYLAQGAKKMIIRHEEFGRLEYSFPEPLVGGVTYRMELKLPENDKVVYRVQANITGANVLFDSQEYTTDDNAQCKIVTTSGTHTITVSTSTEGFESITKTVLLPVGEPLVEDTVYMPSTKQYTLAISSDDGAEFEVDGQLLNQRTRTSQVLPAGMHIVRVRMQTDKYQWYSQPQKIILNGDKSVSLPLKGSLRIAYPTNALCFIEIDGKGEAVSPSKTEFKTGETIALLGRYRLTVRKEGYDDKQISIEISPNQHEDNYRVEMSGKGDTYFLNGEFGKAYNEYEKLANTFEDDKALYSLGVCLYSGKGCPVNSSAALMCWKMAAKLGNVEAVRQLLALTTDEAQRFEYYLSAAQAGDAAAAYEVAERYVNGTGVKINYNCAAYWYSQAVKDCPAANRGLGDLYMEGHGVTPNVSEAQRYYELGSDYGDELSYERLADLEFRNGNKEKAIPMYNALSAPSPAVQARIAKYYIGKKKYQESANIYMQMDSAALIDSNVKTDMEMVANNLYKNSDKNIAINLYEMLYRLYKGNNPFSNNVVYFRLGKYYYDMLDYEKAILYLELGSEQQVGSASYLLGVCYSKGEGVEPDNETALFYFDKAVEQKYERAWYYIGMDYAKKTGDPEAQEMALKYFIKAARAGSKPAQTILKQKNINWEKPAE